MPANAPDARDIRNLTTELKELRKSIDKLNSTLVIIEKRRVEAALEEALCPICQDYRCQSADNKKYGFHDACQCCRVEHDKSAIPLKVGT